jgi:hypothetical protein
MAQWVVEAEDIRNKNLGSSSDMNPRVRQVFINDQTQIKYFHKSSLNNKN